MAGVVLETISCRKLFVLVIFTVLLVFVSIILGGIIAPSPNTHEQVLMTKCLDPVYNESQWYFIRPYENEHCYNAPSFDTIHEIPDQNIDANGIIFAAQFPLPRDGFNLTMSRWFQYVLAVMSFEIKHQDSEKTEKNSLVAFDLRLGYRNRNDPPNEWHELARSSSQLRRLHCALVDRQEGFSNDYFDCEILPLFSLASCHHDEYLLNLRIPVNESTPYNTDIGLIENIMMVEIHQNGGFTKVWFAIKTVAFLLNFLALVFFVHRVRHLSRSPTNLEKAITTLGLGMSILNCPVEWLSLVIDSSFWLLLSDLRQGLFYALLACFWLVFVCEHSVVESGAKPNLHFYRSRFFLIAGCCAALTIFELAERGAQSSNPFYSIWSSPATAYLGIASITIGAGCAFLYFAYLTYRLTLAIKQLVDKRRNLASLPVEQRRFYTSVIRRFSILLAVTLLSAAFTVAFFVFNQITEDQASRGDTGINFDSAFITGVYGVWNAYVFLLLCLYAPSHKFRDQHSTDSLDQQSTQDDHQSDTISLLPLSPRRTVVESQQPSAALAFIQKASLD